MSTLLAIYINGKPRIHGHKRRDFLWSEKDGIYLYEGKMWKAEEFNEAFLRCEKRNYDMAPLVKVIAVEPTAPAQPAPAEKPVLAPVVQMPPQVREMTVEEAEAVMWKHAPEKMKKRALPREIRTLEVG
jgi:hypothetical protein